MSESLDLDLLRCFDHLNRERHLTRAARLAGLSQPAMSRALGRLREVFHDSLFVRTPRGMVPTPRAEALAPQVRAVLEGAEALTTAPRFDPRSLERTFVIGSTDFLEVDLVPRVAGLLERAAPGATIATRPLGADAGERLAAGRLDLIIGVRATVPPDAVTQHLFDDGFVCAVRADHPRVGETLTLDLFTELAHVLIAPRGEPGSPVDGALAALGRSRRVSVRTHSFLAAPLIVARSDLLLTGPSRVLVPVAEPFGLRLLEPPIELPRFGVHQAWHPRMANDPAHAWFRGLIATAARATGRRGS